MSRQSQRYRRWTIARLASLLMVFVFFVSCSVTVAEDWSGFRAVSTDSDRENADLPVRWDRDTNVLWKKAIEGRGWSSPIVSGDRLILTTAVADADLESPKKGLYLGGNRKKPRVGMQYWQVVCLNRKTGNELWRREVANGKPLTPIHLKNSYASETPVTDGERIYAYFGASGLFCLTMDGEPVWQQKPGQFKMRDGWGTSSSAVVDDQHVYVLSDNEESSFLIAYDKQTGDEAWRQQRDEKSSWASPFLWKNAQRTELVTIATKFARSYDPKTGELLWQLGGHSSIAIPTPVATADLLYLSSGFVMDSNRPIFAVKPGGKGDISLDGNDRSSDMVAWKQRKAGPYNTSLLLYKDRLYVLLDRGFLACYDAKTGDRIGRSQRIDGARSGFTSSPWAYDDRIFCLNEDGACFVFAADGKLTQLHTNRLDEMCMATPAISAGTLYVRTIDHVYAIKNDAPATRVAGSLKNSGSSAE